jgi:type VI secretion system protein ImpL
LQTVLDGFLKLPFVAHEGNGRLRDVEAGEQLFWDNDRLQAAIQDKQAYDKFFESQLANTSDNLQDTFEEVALSRLEGNMVDAIASAQQFQPLPAGEQAEQATTNEVRSFQAASQSLTQILEQFSELNFDDDYQDLLRVSSSHALMVLGRVDRAFESRRFYWPPTGNFDSWSGNTPPSSAYGTHNADEMAAFLAAQRQDVQRYAASAQPLAAFLQPRTAKNQKQPLITKWQSIVSDLQKYEAAAPASGLGSVEELLDSGMDKMVPPECQTPVSPVSSGQIYFVQVRRSLERALGSRCGSLSNQSAFQQYTQVANFFNQRLAGKFPFSPPPEDAATPEADPADLTELFRMLDADGKAIRQGLQNPSGASTASVAKITNFLNQLDALRPLFASLTSNQPGAVPALDLAPAFRVNRKHEVNGNQIIDWNLQIGGSTFRNSDPPSTARWTFGDPVRLMLRWAKDSPQQPVPLAPATANSGTRTVIFDYRDPWSLLRILAQHTPGASDLDRSVDSDPQTLVFVAGQEASATGTKEKAAASPSKDAPADQTAKVFIRIRIYAPGKTDALRVPPFPVWAPAP